MLAIGVVLGLCAVAMIGAAYAAFANGTAKTYNEGNSATVTYLTVTPGGSTGTEWDAIASATEDFGTYVYGVDHDNNDTTPKVTRTAYYRTGAPTTTQTIDTVKYALYSLGDKAFSIENKTGAAKSLDMQILPTAAVGNSDFIYVISDGTTYKAIATSGDPAALTFELGSIADSTPTNVTVTLYVGYNVNAYLPASEIGPAVDPVAETGASPDSTNYAQAAHYGDAPVGFSGLTLKFTVLEHPASP